MKKEKQTDKYLLSGKITVICIVITAGLSCIALLGWIMNIITLASISRAYIPMAPSTALIFIILSVGLLFQAHKHTYYSARIFIMIGVVLVLLTSVLILAGILTGIRFEAEHFLFIPEKHGEVLTGYMSPLTAVTFTLASFSLLFLLSSTDNRRQYGNLSSYSAAAVVLSGTIILLGYLYGTPLLYGGTTIPVALPTAIAFVFLGIGLVIAAGLNNWPVRLFMGPSLRSRLMRVFLPITIALVLIQGWLGANIVVLTTNPALLSSLVAVFSVVVVSFIVAWTAKKISYEIDKINTERIKALEALSISEKKFRDLLETVQLAAVMLDCNGSITFCNNYLLAMTGWSRDEALNKNWFDMFLPAEVKESAKSVFNAIINKGTMLHNENPVITREGALRQIVWDIAVLRDPEGNVTGTASLGIDVTEHRKLEGQLRQAQKMEAIGHLAGGVAHDFNNILSAIVGYAHLTLMKMKDDDPLRKNLDQILASSERAANLTQSLLAFSRKQLIIPTPVNINDIVSGIKKILDRIIGEDIKIKVVTAGKDLIVKADKGQIEQALMNLATNARDAMPHGGTLTIINEEAEIDERFIQMHQYGKAGEYAVITVADTGVGMDEKTRANIFEPFFTTKEVGRGTGLGLAMVYGTIKQHDGFINVYSEPGRGTTFRIYLPMAEPGMRLTEKKAAAPVSSGHETILLVEDDEAVRKATKALLEELGYTIIEAVDGEHAIKRLRENKDAMQLVISDIIMPGPSGKAVYDELKRIKSDVEIIFISGYTADILTKKGIIGEGINFLSKPLNPEALSRKIREVLDK
jgi:PAS domain S-box-containing protein